MTNRYGLRNSRFNFKRMPKNKMPNIEPRMSSRNFRNTHASSTRRAASEPQNVKSLRAEPQAATSVVFLLLIGATQQFVVPTGCKAKWCSGPKLQIEQCRIVRERLTDYRSADGLGSDWPQWQKAASGPVAHMLHHRSRQQTPSFRHHRRSEGVDVFPTRGAAACRRHPAVRIFTERNKGRISHSRRLAGTRGIFTLRFPKGYLRCCAMTTPVSWFLVRELRSGLGQWSCDGCGRRSTCGRRGPGVVTCTSVPRWRA